MRVVVAADNAHAYASICALGEQLNVAHQPLHIVQQEADISEKQFQVGAGSGFEVARAQALVAEVGATIPPLEGERRAEVFELAALLGRTPARCIRRSGLTRNLYLCGDCLRRHRITCLGLRHSN